MTVVRVARGCVVALLLAASAPLLAQQAAPAAGGNAVEAIFARWDTDRNGLLSRDEFSKGWAEQARTARRAAMEAVQEGLREQFQAIDANDDAAIDAGEYPGLMLVRRAGDDAPALATFDANRDGRLQFDEYLQLVRRMAATQRAGETP